jgi:hypothetical protein
MHDGLAIKAVEVELRGRRLQRSAHHVLRDVGHLGFEIHVGTRVRQEIQRFCVFHTDSGIHQQGKPFVGDLVYGIIAEKLEMGLHPMHPFFVDARAGSTGSESAITVLLLPHTEGTLGVGLGQQRDQLFTDSLFPQAWQETLDQIGKAAHLAGATVWLLGSVPAGVVREQDVLSGYIHA